MSKDKPKPILTRLANIQQQMDPIEANKEHDHYKTSYFNIDKLIQDLKPKFREQNLGFFQPLTTIDGNPAIKTIIYCTETEETFESTTKFPTSKNPEKMGSSITYFRRYCLVSLLGLPAKDDDANTASNKYRNSSNRGSKQNKQQTSNKPLTCEMEGCDNQQPPEQYKKYCPDCYSAKQ